MASVTFAGISASAAFAALLLRWRFSGQTSAIRRLEADLEGNGPGQRYVEVKRLKGQLLDLVRDFDVLVALDLFAVHYEANRHRVPEFRCELSAFHVFYLRGIFLLCS